jgi:hypothetical protein
VASVRGYGDFRVAATRETESTACHATVKEPFMDDTCGSQTYL